MSKIPFMRLVDMEKIKSNANSYLKYFSNESNDWITTVFDHSPFGETKYELPEINMYMPDGVDPVSTDKENVREIYTKLKFLSDSQASEERLWAGLCMGTFWDYVHYRWKIDTANSIKQHYFFGYGPRRSLTRNAISRLWWIGRLTYDPKREDPFELTDFVCENARFIVDVLERNVSDSIELMREFLTACIDAKKQGLDLDTNTIRELEKYMDILGGIYILDYMPEGFLYEKIISKAQDLISVDNDDIGEDVTGNIDIPEDSDSTKSSKTINPNSKVIVKMASGQMLKIDLTKKKPLTKPKSILGMTVGSEFYISKQKVVVIDIQ